MAQTDNPNPKMQLPEPWAERMACPVCGSRPLGVFHPSGHADRFACQSCETSFELEDAGKRVRFVTLPHGVTPWMRGQWVVLEEALAAFELFRNGQTELTMEGTEETAEVTEAQAPESSQPAETVTPVELQTPGPQELQESKVAMTEQPAVTIESTAETPAQTTATDEPSIEELAREIPVENNFLFAADKPRKHTGGTAPFFDEDYLEKEAPAEPPVEEKPAVEEKEPWKDQEEERVKTALVNPPSSDFAGNLTPQIPWPPAKTETPAPEASLQKASEPAPTIPRQQESPWVPPVPQETKQEIPASVDYSSLEYEPPIRPMDDTPPSIIKPAPASEVPTSASSWSGIGFNGSEDNLDDLRSHIGSNISATAINEKMEDAIERARELYKLGNTDSEVRSILQRSSGLTPEQVSDVLKNLEKPEERKRSNRMLIIFFIVAMVIFAILAVFFTTQFFLNRSTPTLPAGSPTQETSLLTGKILDTKSLPAPIQTLVPNGIQILNESPKVEELPAGTLANSSCPRSKAEAASLFGGPAMDWNQEPQTNGWTLITKTQGVSINIPENMSGGYLVFERGPEMRGVSGPAVVHNIYMISISCP